MIRRTITANEADFASFGTAHAADQQQKTKQGGGEGEGASTSGESGKKLAKKGEALKEEMDSLMDEIDNVLEENAEEFVKNYVQRGGE
jgi:ubiquitin-like protein Pup